MISGKCATQKIPISKTSEGKIVVASFPPAGVGMTVESIETCTLRGKRRDNSLTKSWTFYYQLLAQQYVRLIFLCFQGAAR